MKIRLALAASVLLLSVTGCAIQDDGAESNGTWVGIVTTEGDVTTVVNESGSVWGGTARLVEELTIGVEAGEDPYMFGRVSGIHATADEIYVLDQQKPVVRVYDASGRHLRDIGGEGQGPGEFERPYGLAIGADGRVYVRAFRRQRINVYERDGTSAGALSGGPRFMQAGPLRVMPDGVVYTRGRDSYLGLSSDGPAPPIPFPEVEGEMITVDSVGIPGPGGVQTPTGWQVPFYPWPTRTLSPGGAVISGFGDAYRFTITHRDGRRTVIERRVDPVRLDDDERAWYEETFHQSLRNDGGAAGPVPPIPDHKHFFEQFVASHDGQVWVVRPGPGSRNAECAVTGERCWRDARIADVFETDTGRYLGEVQIPDALRLAPDPYIESGRILGVVQDDAGTTMVRRYRIVLPGEGS